jgi:hypothetical protein
MTIGFTGTQRGMTSAQRETVRTLLQDLKPDIVHHGMCIGADAEFHELARQECVYTIGHPGVTRYNGVHNRADVACDFTCEPKHFLRRNRDIVDRAEILIAAPSGWVEQVRSGTWMTIRYATERGRKLVIVGPDGKVDANFTNPL